MKKLLLTLLVISGVFCAFGQQDKLVTHFIFDKMSFNPGATGMGMKNTICGTMIYRGQWDQFTGAPHSMIGNIEANLSQYFPSAVGISFYQDRIGLSVQNHVLANYSYHLPLGNGLLGMGVGLGINSYSFNPDWVTPDNNPDDATLPSSKGQTAFDANLGFYYMSYTGWYAGLSTTHLPGLKLKDLNFSTARHYYIMGGYKWDGAFNVNKLALEGNALIRTDFKLLSADINVRGIWNKMVYLGVTYRTSDAVAIMVGASWYNFTLGYSYDITTNRFSDISKGSHELLLKYCYKLPPLPITKAKNPRFL